MKDAENDNYDKHRSEYITKIAAMDDSTLYNECYSIIYNSARCSNNPKADWHWMVDSCYSESKKRDACGSIYANAYNRCYADYAE